MIKKLLFSVIGAAALCSPAQATTASTNESFFAVAGLPCSALIASYRTQRFMDLIGPVDDYIQELDAGGDFGSTANITDYVVTECRLNEASKISVAVDHLFVLKSKGALPAIPIGGATDDPDVHATWDAFDRWVRHQGPRPKLAGINGPRKSSVEAAGEKALSSQTDQKNVVALPSQQINITDREISIAAGEIIRAADEIGIKYNLLIYILREAHEQKDTKIYDAVKRMLASAFDLNSDLINQNPKAIIKYRDYAISSTKNALVKLNLSCNGLRYKDDNDEVALVISEIKRSVAWTNSNRKRDGMSPLGITEFTTECGSADVAPSPALPAAAIHSSASTECSNEGALIAEASRQVHQHDAERADPLPDCIERHGDYCGLLPNSTLEEIAESIRASHKFDNVKKLDVKSAVSFANSFETLYTDPEQMRRIIKVTCEAQSN